MYVSINSDDPFCVICLMFSVCLAIAPYRSFSGFMPVRMCHELSCIGICACALWLDYSYNAAGLCVAANPRRYIMFYFCSISDGTVFGDGSGRRSSSSFRMRSVSADVLSTATISEMSTMIMPIIKRNREIETIKNMRSASGLSTNIRYSI